MAAVLRRSRKADWSPIFYGRGARRRGLRASQRLTVPGSSVGVVYGEMTTTIMRGDGGPLRQPLDTRLIPPSLPPKPCENVDRSAQHDQRAITKDLPIQRNRSRWGLNPRRPVRPSRPIKPTYAPRSLEWQAEKEALRRGGSGGEG
jgi:hypothetical protein